MEVRRTFSQLHQCRLYVFCYLSLLTHMRTKIILFLPEMQSENDIINKNNYTATSQKEGEKSRGNYVAV